MFSNGVKVIHVYLCNRFTPLWQVGFTLDYYCTRLDDYSAILILIKTFLQSTGSSYEVYLYAVCMNTNTITSITN